jgi:hypothetical protein
MRKIITAALLLAGTALAAMPAQADVVLGGQNWSFGGVDNLSLTSVVPGGNQPLNIQCVICGDNQPQQAANFGYTNFHNNGSINNALFFSTNVPGGGDPGPNTVGVGYDGSFLRNYLTSVGSTLQFSIGIDVNDNNTAQVLNSFYLLNLTTHTVLSAFTTPTNILSQNNGTGFPDYTLSGFNIALGSDVHVGDQLIFFANLGNMSDGPDSFFIVPAPVPGPIAGAGIPSLIAAFGMIGLAWRRRRARLAA